MGAGYSSGSEFMPGEEGALFDMSVATIQRIHFALISANNFSTDKSSGAVIGWLSSLYIVDRELCPFLSKDDEDLLMNVREKVRRIPELLNNKRMGYNHWSLVSMLDSYERELRKLLHKYKLYMKKREDPGRALLG